MDIVRQLVESRPDFFANRFAHLERAMRINDFIYASPGSTWAYMLLTDAGRIIINTGLGIEAATHKKAFDAVSAGPTPYIVLLQGHVDHIGGVDRFREPGTRLIAQRNNAACQRDDERIRPLRQRQSAIWFGEQMKETARLANQPGVDFHQDQPRPDISFDDRFELELGGLRLELLSVPGGETIDSCALWLPQHGIVFSGNMFGPLFPHFPNFNTIRGDRYRFVEPYLESLARVRALEPEMLIPGRFDPIVGRALIRSCLDRLEAAVRHVHDATLEGMNRGADIWTLMRTIELPESLYVGQGYGKVSWCVRTIWESYMGWFKAAATSELYPTQPREIHAELVALAGIERVLARGGAKLDAGDPEAACLFAEAVLAHEPQNSAALQLSLAAHRALLARSGAKNFWETGWLKNEIARLERMQ